MLPDLDMGGGQQVLRRLLEGMDRARFEHFICYFCPNHEMRDVLEATGASVRHVPYQGRHSWFRTLPAVVRLIREEEIDIVHINGTPLDKLHGQLAAILCRKPVVSTLHGPLLRPAALRPLVQRRVRELFEHVLDPWTTRRVLAVSDEVLESWRPYLRSRRVSEERCLVNRNGIPTASFDPDAHSDEIARVRRELDLDGVYPLLITVGRLDTNKAHRVLISMMTRICQEWPEARLLIVGSGYLEGELRQRIAQLGMEEHVALLGRRQDVPALLGMSDVFVFSSLSEGLPLAVLEAMAAGLPIVSSRLAGLATILEEGVHGFQVESGDVETLANRVLEVLANPERARVMGEAGRQRVVGHYDLDGSIRCLERVYEEVARS
jgi:glycosyltransferase involved in cell wall biosynthesis